MNEKQNRKERKEGKLKYFPDTLKVEGFAGRDFCGDKLSRTPMVKSKFCRDY